MTDFDMDADLAHIINSRHMEISDLLKLQA